MNLPHMDTSTARPTTRPIPTAYDLRLLADPARYAMIDYLYGTV